jgi:hypothetical protein
MLVFLVTIALFANVSFALPVRPDLATVEMIQEGSVALSNPPQARCLAAVPS